MGAFPVVMPSGQRYWTVLDDGLEVFVVADRWASESAVRSGPCATDDEGVRRRCRALFVVTPVNPPGVDGGGPGPRSVHGLTEVHPGVPGRGGVGDAARAGGRPGAGRGGAEVGAGNAAGRPGQRQCPRPAGTVHQRTATPPAPWPGGLVHLGRRRAVRPDRRAGLSVRPYSTVTWPLLLEGSRL